MKYYSIREFANKIWKGGENRCQIKKINDIIKLEK